MPSVEPDPLPPPPQAVELEPPSLADLLRRGLFLRPAPWFPLVVWCWPWRILFLEKRARVFHQRSFSRLGKLLRPQLISLGVPRWRLQAWLELPACSLDRMPQWHAAARLGFSVPA